MGRGCGSPLKSQAKRLSDWMIIQWLSQCILRVGGTVGIWRVSQVLSGRRFRDHLIYSIDRRKTWNVADGWDCGSASDVANRGKVKLWYGDTYCLTVESCRGFPSNGRCLGADKKQGVWRGGIDVRGVHGQQEKGGALCWITAKGQTGSSLFDLLENVRVSKLHFMF